MENKTVAAISTAYGTGGIAVIRISGEETLNIIKKVFIPAKGKAFSHSKAGFGKIIDKDFNLVDSGICTFFKAPFSYTGEDVAEISCHGGIVVTKSVLDTVLSAGAYPAGRGEFTKRAFLNGKLDLSEAEGVIDLINADSFLSSKAALWQLEGLISERIKKISDSLIYVNAKFLAFIDYPDDEIEETDREKLLKILNDELLDIQRLISSFDAGSIIKDGVKTAIIGAPNSGKSSFMNSICKKERSIVTEIAGTTRDIVEDHVTVGGLKLILSDTAGLREAEDVVEKIGVERAKKAADAASLILCVVDGSKPLDNNDLTALSLCNGKKAIAIYNKTDLGEIADKNVISKFVTEIIPVSSKTGYGITDAEKTIKGLFDLEKINGDNGEIITNIRHKNSLEKAEKNLVNGLKALSDGMTLDAVASDIADAIASLGEITGDTVSEEIVKSIFENFCVGK